MGVIVITGGSDGIGAGIARQLCWLPAWSRRWLWRR
jgi:NAD(P)-dependent dehydrogenase (short-subunit alcohol dehydrogenase family)